jgi:hypothetical protein
MARRGKKNVDDVLIMALACGATWEAAAQQAGVSKQTVYRRMKEPAFLQRLREHRGDMLKSSSGALAAAVTEAIGTLLSLQPATIPPAVRCTAARAILELSLRMHEAVDLETRIAALEKLSVQRPEPSGNGQWPEIAYKGRK